MNPNLTQRRRGAEKEGGMVVSTVKDTQPRLQRNHMIPMVGTPLPTQASGASAPSAMPSKKKEFAVASGEPKKQDSGQQAANSSLNLVARCRKTS
jgi:hypothetical protein